MSYDILDHTADAKFRATGDSLEQAFSESVKAFAEIVGTDPEAGDTRHEIKVESENSEALLFDFLDELIFLQDANNIAVCHAEEIMIDEAGDGYSLEATIWTDVITSDMDLLDIKAPTYNEMDVDYQKGEGWVIEAVLDI
jgi:SHS2 domain-containing protein